MRRTGLLLLAVSLGLIFSFSKQSAKAQSQILYNIVDLGSLGGTVTEALDMNEAGMITGMAFWLAEDATTRRAFVYTPGVGIADLGIIGDGGSYGLKINEAGQIMGRYNLGSSVRTFIYTPGTGISDIGKLALDQVIGQDMNASGRIAGDALMSESWVDGHHVMTYHPFLYTPGTGMVDLDPWGGSGPNGQASAINDSGQVTGRIHAPTGTFPFVYNPGSGIERIYPYGSGVDVNENGWVTGSISQSGVSQALIYVPGTGVIASSSPYSIGIIINQTGLAVGVWSTRDRPNYGCFTYSVDPASSSSHRVDITYPDAVSCFPRALNDVGHVVGISKFADESVRAFLYRDGTRYDLTSLIPSDSGWVLEVAEAINNKGWITGYTHHNGETRSYLLIPAQTDIGTNVEATPVDTNGHGIPITVGFERVLTAGATRLWMADPTPYSWGFNLTTTATYSGDVIMCLNYSQANFVFDESWLALVHYEDSQWKNITSSLDTVKNIICGVASSLSPFAVMARYSFTGFFSPIENEVLNTVKAGSAVPIKFSLGTDRGLDILSGLPTSYPIACSGSESGAPVSESVTAGSSGLTYDAVIGQYVYVWKTDKTWSGCRQFDLTLSDGTTHTANFQFTK